MAESYLHPAHWTSSTRFTEAPGRVVMESNLGRRHEVKFAPALLRDDGEMLFEAISHAPALIITTPSVDRYYGRTLRKVVQRFGGRHACDYHVLECRENAKDIQQTLNICEIALNANLRRGGTIVAIGGGVCMDVAGLAAAIYRRGVRHIKVPTTLIGLIDAGIGIKNGINFRQKKSALGSFYPPELTLLDPAFLRTLPELHIRDGLSEALKMAIVDDRTLFELMEANADSLLPRRLDTQAGHDVITRSVKGMLAALSENLYELDGYCRMVDFGHTFSPFIESATAYEVTHGQAVAIDMAISATLARNFGLLDEEDFERILQLMHALSLPIFHKCTLRVDEFHRSLEGIVAHRDGALNLVVPNGIGAYEFVHSASDVPRREIEAAVKYLEERHATVRDRGLVY
ncbi:sedoheptulose 7-phosphate cyclase [Burkholderia thailandensis]|uniref:sedoheptulose 7-phosphate cyclase n=1 Tax=Burkholderia thailandensis TaxID=57975 RepID=UPI0003EC8B06|nr:sedoheptulose 7-phosphate cyclase [Burkholderia thailandensis]AHI66373.1 3-dehydroquinate synthase family protein [Burkholderia thailandensis H0587]MCS3393115.1 sedoheptulose 7-phosphate cyclase [Burkholderia thailandensis]MCS6429036.1 sedoheptulose 7-phosphate cyclase [Burkholderia thailandensis]MCS6454529.1 sedoheptulose 7-phosphate cyclase [Burkholderia thailandensis]MCS6468099.1 sedoheptulose 7-phosphate cyclase [Burkholderia thailandensis]